MGFFKDDFTFGVEDLSLVFKDELTELWGVFNAAVVAVSLLVLIGHGRVHCDDDGL
jgi:hypothetical protein